MAYKRIKTPTKLFGGLHYHAPKIAELFPARDKYDHFIDACCGGMSILLAHDPEGKAEIANDLSGDLSNLWRVLRSPVLSTALIKNLSICPFSEREWRDAIERLAVFPGEPWEDWHGHLQVERADAFFIMARQSLAGRHGKNPSFAGITQTRVRRGFQEQVSAWLSAVDGLPAVAERLSRVLVLNRDVIKLVKDWDVPRAFIFLDPPWLDETRSADQVYEQEMTRVQHSALLHAITSCNNAMVMIAGRRCIMYEYALKGWHSFDVTHKSSSGSGKKKGDMTFCLWRNYK